MTLVFVYGTLKMGQPNYFRILDISNGTAKFLGRARTVDRYPVVIATKYNIPFMLNLPGTGHHVQGEIYSVDDKMLDFLDRFESCPQMYQRCLIKLVVEEWLEEAESKPEAGDVLESFVYNTTTYKPEWLQNTTYQSYDAYGDHGLEYVSREARSSDHYS